MDSWLNGKLLNINEKYDEKTFAEKTTNPMVKALFSNR